jgi:hypothetical protein
MHPLVHSTRPGHCTCFTHGPVFQVLFGGEARGSSGGQDAQQAMMDAVSRCMGALLQVGGDTHCGAAVPCTEHDQYVVATGMCVKLHNMHLVRQAA